LLSGSLCGTIVIHDTQQQLTVKQTCPAICKIRPCSQTKASISRLQWYPHDTGIFTSSGSDSHLKIWDTNSLSVVEQFRFRGRVNFHTMGRNSTHCLIAGILLCFVYMVYAHAVYVGDNFHRACSENLVVICDFISQMTSPNYCRCGFFACLKFC
jgi:WD40 repeat protein